MLCHVYPVSSVATAFAGPRHGLNALNMASVINANVFTGEGEHPRGRGQKTHRVFKRGGRKGEGEDKERGRNGEEKGRGI